MNWLIRTSAGLLSLTLFGFAALQLNDPDPIIWVGFYSICALVPLLLVFGRFSSGLFWVSLVLCAVQLGIAAPEALAYLHHSAQEPLMQAMNPDKPYIEAAREFLGAAIALLLVSACKPMARKLGLR